MARNLSRIANHDSKREAINDYVYVSLKAIGQDRQDIVDAHPVKPGYGWRRIDKCTAAIRAEFGWPLVYEMRDADAAPTPPLCDRIAAEPSGGAVQGASDPTFQRAA